MRIERLDAGDPEAMAAWHAAYLGATTYCLDYPTPWMLEEMRAQLLGDRTAETVLAFAGTSGDAVVTTGWLVLPLADNLRQARIEVTTVPTRRNQGLGTAMLDHLTETAREHGRSILTAMAAYPYDVAADGAGHPNAGFLLRRGFSFGLGDVQRVLDLPADVGRLEALAAEAAVHHRRYEVRQFRGPVPDDLVDSFGRLIGSLVTEAPSGEMEVEVEVFDVDRIRADERVFEESGRTKYTTVALDGDGTAVAYSELVVPGFDPGRAYQWGTLALPAHRGHRLGLATKVRNLLWMQAEHPDVRLLLTFNAEVNRHMIDVNEQMGFRPVGRLGEFQRRLPQRADR